MNYPAGRPVDPVPERQESQEQGGFRNLIADRGPGAHTSRGTAFFLLSALERLSAAGLRAPSQGPR
jgi:hypothetical protein